MTRDQLMKMSEDQLKLASANLDEVAEANRSGKVRLDPGEVIALTDAQARIAYVYATLARLK